MFQASTAQPLWHTCLLVQAAQQYVKQEAGNRLPNLRGLACCLLKASTIVVGCSTHTSSLHTGVGPSLVDSPAAWHSLKECKHRLHQACYGHHTRQEGVHQEKKEVLVVQQAHTIYNLHPGGSSGSSRSEMVDRAMRLHFGVVMVAAGCFSRLLTCITCNWLAS